MPGVECWVLNTGRFCQELKILGYQAQFSWDPGVEGGGAGTVTDWSQARPPCNPADLLGTF